MRQTRGGSLLAACCDLLIRTLLAIVGRRPCGGGRLVTRDRGSPARGSSLVIAPPSPRRGLSCDQRPGFSCERVTPARVAPLAGEGSSPVRGCFSQERPSPGRGPSPKRGAPRLLAEAPLLGEAPLSLERPPSPRRGAPLAREGRITGEPYLIAGIGDRRRGALSHD